jgi:hypothetical protein
MIRAENLEKTFNLSPIIEGEFTVEGTKDIITTNPNNVPVIVENGKLDDSDYIRTNLKELVDSTKNALDLALEIQAEDPTNFKNTEAVAKMADSVAKALGNLIHLNKTEKDEKYRSNVSEDPKIVNNNLVITTTEDLINKIMLQVKHIKDSDEI